MSKVVKEGDKLEDWSFCSEIFDNRKPVFSKYDLQYPYEYKTKGTIRGVKKFCRAY